jgi:hypothetical protein
MPYTKDFNTFHGRGKMDSKSLDIARTVLASPDMSYRAVGDQFGVTRQRVGAIVRRMGVARRRGFGDVEG